MPGLPLRVESWDKYPDALRRMGILMTRKTIPPPFHLEKPLGVVYSLKKSSFSVPRPTH